MKRKKKSENLPELIQANDGVKKALDALIRGLSAKRSFSQNGQTKTEDDAATQVKAALGILEFASAKPKAREKEEPPGPKLTPVEREEEVRRILGIE